MAGSIETSGSLEKPSDAGPGDAGMVARWKMALDMADKQEREWRDAAKAVIDRFRQEDQAAKGDRDSKVSRFNILWSNTEVMRPALYHSTPKPDVRRRYRDEDPLGKLASEIMERALKFSIDVYDFDSVMGLATHDVLLPGRAVTRVRYEPVMKTVTPPPVMPDPVGVDELGNASYAPEDVDEGGNPVPKEQEPYEAIDDQKVTCEHVQWDDFRRGPGCTWEQVDWIAFRHFLTRDQLVDMFGDIGRRVNLDYTPEGRENTHDEDEPDLFKRATVHEIWDKEKRRVIFIATSYKDEPLRVDDDPLGLSGFYPIPRPMYALESSNTLIPVEMFRLYKDQADELDRITKRINGLVKGLKLRGIYDSTLGAMQALMAADDNELVPTGEQSLALLQQGGAFEKAIWMMPIERVAQVLRELYVQRDQVKQTIYEITGLSDVLRGATDPNETLGAQQLKAQSGSRRLRRLQKEVQRYARDLMRITAEIIAEHFEPGVLSMMTGQQVTPELVQLLREDMARTYRIDIETDSTIAEDEQQDQEALTKILDGITRYVAAVGPVVQQGYMPPKAAIGLLKTIVRRFKMGREVEDALDQAEGQIEKSGGQMKKTPEQQAAEAEMQARQQEVQANLQAKQSELMLKQQAAEADERRKQEAFERDQERLDRAALAEINRLNAETNAKINAQQRSAEAQAEAMRMKARAKPKEKRAA